MLDDFFTRALLAGIGVALVAGPFGCFMVWRRQAYFGDTLAHSALLGVALGFLFQVHTIASVFAVAVLVSLLLVYLQRQKILSSDSLLGMLSHTSLALGLVVLALMPGNRINLLGVLFGDILAVSTSDLLMIYLGGAVLLAALMIIWKPLFASTIDVDLARAEGMDVDRANLVFMVLMALVIAVAMKLVGVLLITALLVIPAVTSRRFAAGAAHMVMLSAICGMVSVVAGLYGSLVFDLPSGPSIVLASFLLFLAGGIIAAIKARASSVAEVKDTA